MYDKDEIKQNITIEQMIDIVEALGASTPIVRSEILMIENICHNLPGESRGHKLYYYDNTKLFRCYTDCGEYFDVFELVIKTRKIQENEDWEMFKAIIWVADFLGIAPKLKEFDDMDSDASQFLKEIKALEKTLAMLNFKCWYYERALADGNEDKIKEMLPDKLPSEIQESYDKAHS